MRLVARRVGHPVAPGQRRGLSGTVGSLAGLGLLRLTQSAAMADVLTCRRCGCICRFCPGNRHRRVGRGHAGRGRCRLAGGAGLGAAMQQALVLAAHGSRHPGAMAALAGFRDRLAAAYPNWRVEIARTVGRKHGPASDFGGVRQVAAVLEALVAGGLRRVGGAVPARGAGRGIPRNGSRLWGVTSKTAARGWPFRSARRFYPTATTWTRWPRQWFRAWPIGVPGVRGLWSWATAPRRPGPDFIPPWANASPGSIP